MVSISPGASPPARLRLLPLLFISTGDLNDVLFLELAHCFLTADTVNHTGPGTSFHLSQLPTLFSAPTPFSSTSSFTISDGVNHFTLLHTTEK